MSEALKWCQTQVATYLVKDLSDPGKKKVRRRVKSYKIDGFKLLHLNWQQVRFLSSSLGRQDESKIRKKLLQLRATFKKEIEFASIPNAGFGVVTIPKKVFKKPKYFGLKYKPAKFQKFECEYRYGEDVAAKLYGKKEKRIRFQHNDRKHFHNPIQVDFELYKPRRLKRMIKKRQFVVRQKHVKLML